MGSIVFLINLDHGWEDSLIAAIKQWAYTFLFGGIIIKLLEQLIIKVKRRQLAIAISVTSVSLITTLLVFIVHSLKGTPEPILSTVPTILMAPPGFLILALRFQKSQFNK